jgi:glycosyltransferase involved in cell wall biosynthesis
VPSIAPWLDRARIGLIPEALGGGFKLKALDYIFRGLPVAAIRPALSGLPIDPGQDAIVAGDQEGLARAIATRIHDTDFLARAASSALEKCRQAFDWKDRGAALAEALR